MKTNLTPFFYQYRIYYRTNDGTWYNRKGKDLALKAAKYEYPRADQRFEFIKDLEKAYQEYLKNC